MLRMTCLLFIISLYSQQAAARGSSDHSTIGYWFGGAFAAIFVIGCIVERIFRKK